LFGQVLLVALITSGLSSLAISAPNKKVKALSAPANAQVASAPTSGLHAEYLSRVMTYAELMSLSTANRHRYIIGLQQIIHEAALVTKSKNDDFISMIDSTIEDRAKLFSLLVEPVVAQDDVWALPEGFENAPIATNPSYRNQSCHRTVDLLAGNPMPDRKIAVGCRAIFNWNFLKKTCNAGYIGVNKQPDGNWMCVTRESYYALSDAQRVKIGANSTGDPINQRPDDLTVDRINATEQAIEDNNNCSPTYECAPRNVVQEVKTYRATHRGDLCIHGGNVTTFTSSHGRRFEL
jgi:hypothetical protein